MLRSALAVAGLSLGLVLAAPVGAAQLIEIKQVPNGFNINDPSDLSFFDAIDLDEAAELSLLSLAEDGGSFDTTGGKYLTVKASTYVALYALDGGDPAIDTSAWGLLQQNGREFMPGVSNVRVWGVPPANPIPEPHSIALFLGGGALVGGAIWRRRRPSA